MDAAHSGENGIPRATGTTSRLSLPQILQSSPPVVGDASFNARFRDQADAVDLAGFKRTECWLRDTFAASAYVDALWQQLTDAAPPSSSVASSVGPIEVEQVLGHRFHGLSASRAAVVALLAVEGDFKAVSRDSICLFLRTLLFNGVLCHLFGVATPAAVFSHAIDLSTFHQLLKLLRIYFDAEDERRQFVSIAIANSGNVAKGGAVKGGATPQASLASLSAVAAWLGRVRLPLPIDTATAPRVAPNRLRSKGLGASKTKPSKGRDGNTKKHDPAAEMRAPHPTKSRWTSTPTSATAKTRYPLKPAKQPPPPAVHSLRQAPRLFPAVGFSGFSVTQAPSRPFNPFALQ